MIKKKFLVSQSDNPWEFIFSICKQIFRLKLTVDAHSCLRFPPCGCDELPVAPNDRRERACGARPSRSKCRGKVGSGEACGCYCVAQWSTGWAFQSGWGVWGHPDPTLASVFRSSTAACMGQHHQPLFLREREKRGSNWITLWNNWGLSPWRISLCVWNRSKCANYTRPTW